MPEYIRTITTDSDGEATTNLTEGEYEFETSADGYSSETRTVVIDGEETVSVSLVADEPEPEGDHDLTLVLRDSSGDLVANVSASIKLKSEEIGGDILEIEEGETHITPEGVTEEYGEVNNNGTHQNDGTLVIGEPSDEDPGDPGDPGEPGDPIDAREGTFSNEEYLLVGDPPERSDTEYVSDYSGLQDAIDSIDSDTRLVCDTGPYTGNYHIPLTNHITIDGDGTTITRGDSDEAIISTSNGGDEFSDSTDPSGTYSAGQSSIALESVSGFSEGDIIRIFDPEQVHPEQPPVSSGTNQGQGVFHVVEEVDSSDNELHLEEDLLLDWDDPEGDLRIDNVNWQAVDQRITGFDFEAEDSGRNGGRHLIEVRRRKEFWYDDCTLRDGRNGLWIYEGYQIRVHDSEFHNLGSSSGGQTDYPLDIVNGTHHWMVTECLSTDSQRYGFKSGSGSPWWPCRNGRFVDCHAEDVDGRRAYDQHPGSHNVDYFDCSSEGCGFHRPRSRGWYSEGTECVDPGQFVMLGRGTPSDIRLQSEHYTGDTHEQFLQIHVNGAWDIDNFELHDVWCDGDGDMQALCRIRHDTNETCEVETLVLDHVAVGDTWVTESNFDNWRTLGGDWDFPNIESESPSDQSPSEYFGDEYGW